MAITNLNEYYASKGQALPSVSQRAGLASQAGISNYTGTAQQNAILLKSLNSPTPATNVNTTTIPTNTPAPTSAPVIPVGVVTSPQNQMPLPTMPTSTTAGTLGATAGQFLTQPVVNTSADLAEANQVAQQNADLASGNYEEQVLGLINNLTNRPGELAQQYNIQQLGADQQTAKAKYDAIQLEYRRQKEAETTNPALSAEQKQARLSEIGRKESSQLADIAIDYSLKAGLFTQAKTLMDEQIKNELEPLKMKVEYYKTLKDDYSDVLNKTQTAQLNNIIRQEDRVYQEKQDKLKFERDRQLQNEKMNAEINASNSLTLKQKQSLLKDPTSREINDRIALNNVIKEHADKIKQIKLQKATEYIDKFIGNKKIDPIKRQEMIEKQSVNMEIPSDKRRELNTAIEIAIAPFIAVSGGQGAIGAEEAPRYIDSLKIAGVGKNISTGTGNKVLQSAEGAIAANKSIARSKIMSIESAYPGYIDSISNINSFYYGTDNVESLSDTELLSIPPVTKVTNEEFFNN